MTAREDLSAAMARALTDWQFIPCAGRADEFTSDDRDVLEAVAVECHDCPALAACKAAGRREQWGVWGGTVKWPTWAKRPTSSKPGRPAKESA